jgi:hypothetical protein
MGAYKYIGELYKKKQSDVLRFLLRVRYVSVLHIAVGRISIADMKQLLGVSPAERHPPSFTPVAPRQGSPAWLQSKTRIRYLSRACAPR